MGHHLGYSHPLLHLIRSFFHRRPGLGQLQYHRLPSSMGPPDAACRAAFRCNVLPARVSLSVSTSSRALTLLQIATLACTQRSLGRVPLCPHLGPRQGQSEQPARHARAQRHSRDGGVRSPQQRRHILGAVYAQVHQPHAYWSIHTDLVSVDWNERHE